MKLEDVFSFEKMLTPKLIMVFYWIVLIAAVLGGIGVFVINMIIGNFEDSIVGLLKSITILFVTRVSLESVMALFRIHTGIKRLEKKLNISELDEQV